MNYFGSIQLDGLRNGYESKTKAFKFGGIENRFNQLDNSESGEEKGNGSLTADTWNNLMSQLGIAGHRIKEKISLEEVKSFLQKMCGAN